MTSLWLTSRDRTASRAPTYSVEPSSLNNSVVVLWTSGRLKWTRGLSAESGHTQQTWSLVVFERVHSTSVPVCRLHTSAGCTGFSLTGVTSSSASGVSWAAATCSTTSCSGCGSCLQRNSPSLYDLSFWAQFHTRTGSVLTDIRLHDLYPNETNLTLLYFRLKVEFENIFSIQTGRQSSVLEEWFITVKPPLGFHMTLIGHMHSENVWIPVWCNSSKTEPWHVPVP